MMHTPTALLEDWYVGFTKPRQEAVARDNLMRQGFEVYLPKYKVFKRGQRSEVFEPMFPRYLMLRPENPERSLAVVRSTVGMVGLVRFGQRPARLSDSVVAAIRQREAERAAAPPETARPFATGQAVRVVAGPLAGLAGIVQGSAHDRVAVLLDLLGRPTRTQIPGAQLDVA